MDKKIEECKKAVGEIFDQLESQGIEVIGCGVTLDNTHNVIAFIHLHISEENKKYDLPTVNKGFQIKYEYSDYPEFA